VPRGYRTIKIELPKRGEIAAVYTSARVADALREITEDANLYHGVRLVQVMEAVYLQGRKDGAREAFRRDGRGFGRRQEPGSARATWPSQKGCGSQAGSSQGNAEGGAPEGGSSEVAAEGGVSSDGVVGLAVGGPEGTCGVSSLLSVFSGGA